MSWNLQRIFFLHVARKPSQKCEFFNKWAQEGLVRELLKISRVNEYFFPFDKNFNFEISFKQNQKVIQHSNCVICLNQVSPNSVSWGKTYFLACTILYWYFQFSCIFTTLRSFSMTLTLTLGTDVGSFKLPEYRKNLIVQSVNLLRFCYERGADQQRGCSSKSK